ncbi:hypothetical protein, partial [Acinetobacter ursingii]|uniref:hypothetical protein n=1 Tax=Acinetobacter ursingii TaxID=108980 RepID=UPI001C08FE4A
YYFAFLSRCFNKINHINIVRVFYKKPMSQKFVFVTTFSLKRSDLVLASLWLCLNKIVKHRKLKI